MTSTEAAVDGGLPPVVDRNRRLGLRWGLLAVGMIAFTVVLWYTGDMLCDWAGIGIAPGADRPRSEIRLETGAVP